MSSYGSLKLKYLFDTLKKSESKNLNKQVIQMHQDRMLDLLKIHYCGMEGDK